MNANLDRIEESVSILKTVAFLFNYPEENNKQFFYEVFNLFPDYFSSSNVTDSMFNDLQVFYTKLFITDFPSLKAPPFECAYREEEPYEIMLSLQNFYERNGFLYEENEIKRPDFVVYEILFLSHLLESNNLNEFNNFLEQHFDLWIFKFFENVKEQSTKITFYYELLELLIDEIKRIKSWQRSQEGIF